MRGSRSTCRIALPEPAGRRRAFASGRRSMIDEAQKACVSPRTKLKPPPPENGTRGPKSGGSQPGLAAGGGPQGVRQSFGGRVYAVLAVGARDFSLHAAQPGAPRAYPAAGVFGPAQDHLGDGPPGRRSARCTTRSLKLLASIEDRWKRVAVQLRCAALGRFAEKLLNACASVTN